MTLEQREYAIHRIRAKRQFFLHVAFFAAMATYFIVLWAQSSAAFFWPVWPMIGWGIGLVAHASHVFGWERGISEERIRREIDRSI
jgi:cytochrome c oxidase assembly factor CtaG